MFKDIEGEQEEDLTRIREDVEETAFYIMRNYKKRFIFVLGMLVFTQSANVASSMFTRR